MSGMEALLQDVFPYLVAFYLADGLAHVRPRQSLFCAGFGGACRLRAGIHLAGLAPWVEVIAVDEDPVLLLPCGLGAFDLHTRYAPPVPEPDDIEILPWETLGEVRVEGRRLATQGRVLCVATSRASARALAERIAAVRRAPAAQRERILEEQLEASTDADPLRAVRRWSRLLRGALSCIGAVQGFFVFALLPAALYGPLRPFPLVPVVIAVAIDALLAAALGGALAWRCGARRGLAQELLPLVLFPPSAARALAHLSRGLHARFDAAVLGLELLPLPRFVAWAREELHRAALGREAARGSALEGWYLSRERAWRRVLRQGGLTVDEVLAAPHRSSGSRSYCPLCSSEYREGFTVCGDCGVGLLPLDDPGQPSAASSTVREDRAAR